MADAGAIPLASMGEDTPLACLSERPRRFYHYFNQLFSQVTNPPIDALRESYITSTLLYLGNHGNLLEDARTTPSCQTRHAASERRSVAALASIGQRASRPQSSWPPMRPMTDRTPWPGRSRNSARQAEGLVRGGVNILALSDRAGRGLVPCHRC